MTKLTLFAAIAIAAHAAGAQEPEDPRFTFRLHGGLVYPTGFDASPKELTLNHAAYGADAAVGYRLHRNLALELGVGFFRVVDAERPVPTEFELNVIPLTAVVRAVKPLSGGGELSASAGVGLHLSRLRTREDQEVGPLVQGEESAAGLGGYLGLGWSARVGPGTLLGLELRYVKSATSFEGIAYRGDGVQLLGGFTFLSGGRGANSAVPADGASVAPPVDAADAAGRWRSVVRFGAFVPVGRDLDALGTGLQGELGLARRFTPHVEAEVALGYLGAKTDAPYGDLPELMVWPLTLSGRIVAPVGSRLEVSPVAGAGVYVTRFRRSSANTITSAAPGAHVGVALAARLARGVTLGVDARLFATSAPSGGADPQDLFVGGVRVGGMLTVPLPR